MIEPFPYKNESFFQPKIVEVTNGQINIPNESNEVVQIKKSCQIAKITAIEQVDENNPNQ